jgi:uncharacterized protein (TIGR03435 family)
LRFLSFIYNNERQGAVFARAAGPFLYSSSPRLPVLLYLAHFFLLLGSNGPRSTPIESHRDPRGMEAVVHGASIGGEPVGDLAGWLQFYLGKRVIDQTGITGTYNFTLQFHGTLSDMGTNDGSMWPPVESAIQEQLGLQLRDTKAPAQVLVIDHIEMPSPN